MSLTQIKPHIHQLTLPLPFALNHVHCYLLDDGDGWTIIDCGLHTAEGEAGWQNAFAELEVAPSDLKRIIVTHTHPDHYGMAGWLQAWGSGDNGRVPPVLLSPREQEIAVNTWQHGEERIARMTSHLKSCGLSDAMAEQVASETKFVSDRTQPHPNRVEALEAGQEVEMARRTFRTISVPGHSDGQLIFYDAADRLLLSADHVLMKITPNISTWPNGDPNPLGLYLDSIERLKSLEVSLALPGHKQLITDWHGRLAELKLHHANRLQDTIAAVNGGTTVRKVAMSVFRLKQLTVHEARFAITETLAHLDYLVADGRLRCENGEVWRYYRV